MQVLYSESPLDRWSDGESELDVKGVLAPLCDSLLKELVGTSRAYIVVSQSAAKFNHRNDPF